MQVLEIGPTVAPGSPRRLPSRPTEPDSPASAHPVRRGTYRYEAVAADGSLASGTVQASSGEHAIRLITERGIRPNAVYDAQTGAPAFYRTSASSDKERFFVFSQLAQQVRAGIGPAQALAGLGSTVRDKPMAEALRHAGRVAAEGGPISAVLELYPDLFPASVPGMVRAGEQGGFLPDALQAISDQALLSHKFRRFFWFVWFCAANALLAIPFAFYLRSGLLKAWEVAEGGVAAAPGSPAGSILATFASLLLWPTLPIVGALAAATLILRRLLSGRAWERRRHALGLRVKTFGARARHENLSVFSWTLANLGRAGIPPRNAWWLAANAVPNLAIRDRLVSMGSRMGEGAKLSEAAIDPGLFPPEYAPMLATGEAVGDVEGSLQRLAEMSRQEFETAQAYAKARSGCWGLLAVFVTMGIVLIVIAIVWYRELPARVLEGL